MKKRCKKRLMLGEPTISKPVDECHSAMEVMEKSFTCFGGGDVKRFCCVLKEIAEKQIPTVIAAAGPITTSDQHRGWLVPLMKILNVAYITVTDAICYHDGHDCIKKTDERVIREIDLRSDDAELRKEGIIRITDTGFPESVLYDQDRMISAILQRPEFQKAMTTTERNYLLGKYYLIRENKFGIRPGLLSFCYQMEIPVFIGAPADGSVFLNSVKLWYLSQGTKNGYKFSIDLHADVFEAAAYHYWGLFGSQEKSLAALIFGGGVSKNYILQPEPFLSQILMLGDIRGYDFDLQIVSADEKEGSLSGAKPDEAVSWGKVNPMTYRKKTVSLRADYTMLMNPVVYSLVRHMEGKIIKKSGLYERREELVEELKKAASKNKKKLKKTLEFSLEI